MRMLCRSAPISPRNAAVSESTASAPAWPPLSVGESFNDVERRAGPVSPSSEAQGTRSPAATSRRLRPRFSGRAPQQRPADGGTLRSERPAAEPLRLRRLETSRESGGAEQSATPAPGSAAVAAGERRLRHRHRRPSGGGGELSGAAKRADDVASAGKAPERTSRVTRLVLGLIRGYQRSISPGLGTVCRYQPSCSHYAYAAIERHGLLQGGWLAARRLLRCRPFGANGYDPVPD